MLIVGAGPTGLTLGIALRRQGIECLILDRLGEPSRHSRALGLHARTLEIFAAMQVLPTVRSGSMVQKAVSVYGESGFLFELDLTTLKAPYPWVLSCPQTVVEAALTERYLALGGKLERAVELLDFAQDGSGVRARVRRGSEVSQLEAALLVGADGVGSTVRQQLGIGFHGVDYNEHFLLADVSGLPDLRRDSSHGFLMPEGALFVLPMPEGWRLIISGAPPQEEAPVTLAPFRERLERVLPSPVELGEPRWLSQFTVQRRLAQHYRRNRVFLAGDAAHVQSPLGAQGMNTGIADAFNLGWKLALYLQGYGNGELLDSYEQERRPVAIQMLNQVEVLSRASLLRLPLLRRTRDSLLKMAGSRPQISQRLLRRASQLDVNYRQSPLVAFGPEAALGRRHFGPLPGDRVPDAALKSLRTGRDHQLQDLLQQPVHHLVIQLTAQPAHHEQMVLFALSERIPEEYRDRVHLTVIAAEEGADALSLVREGTTRIWHDHRGEFARAFGEQSRLWLIRPDGHLGYRAPVSDADHLLGYLERLFRRH
ncbi:oxidoreductase [Alcanivorax hongdengensis A-11-3]|uniref:Oxidoreductase n=1 Tax=Alcanivorax hongdengensis A-11-3 TaxID=1177179 RepID=L0W7K4_9GAMM|nr:FAD-dependent monooxygenase [Alcanivorax hongdengensis]EKF72899.1 oxidoreductase [Alcanivorax hongdengensis A-11-3]